MNIHLSNNDNPRLTDTKWRLWLRALLHYQSHAGADPANNPQHTDTLWRLKLRLLKAIKNS